MADHVRLYEQLERNVSFSDGLREKEDWDIRNILNSVYSNF